MDAEDAVAVGHFLLPPKVLPRRVVILTDRPVGPTCCNGRANSARLCKRPCFSWAWAERREILAGGRQNLAVRDGEVGRVGLWDRKSTRLKSSDKGEYRMPSSAR